MLRLRPTTFVFFCLAVIASTHTPLERAVAQSQQQLVTHDRVDVSWPEGSSWMQYSVNTAPQQLEHFKVNLESGTKLPIFDAQSLTEALKRQPNSDAISVDTLASLVQSVALQRDGATVHFTYQRKRWQFNEAEGLSELGATPDALNQHFTNQWRSSGGNGDTNLEFTNASNQQIQCFWLSTNGTEQAYQTVRVQQSIEQHTFAGHIWSLRTVKGDGEGEELLRIRAPDHPLSIVIDEESIRAFREFRESNRQGREGRGSRGRRRPNASGWLLRDHNILREGNGDEGEQRLTSDGNAKNQYRFPLLESPSGKYLAAIQEEVVKKRTVQIISSSPRDQLQPEVLSFEYPKPGDEIDHPHIRLFDLDSQTPIQVEHALMPNPWSLDRVQWLDDPERLICIYNERGHQTLRVLSIDPTTGTVTPLIDEASSTFIDYSQKTYLRLLNDDREILWASERSGFNHLYRFDSISGQLLNAVTSGDWVVREVVKIDEQQNVVFFGASGVIEGQDPYFVHLCRADLDGSNFRVLTEADGNHTWEFSPDGTVFVDRFSRVDMPPVHQLRRSEDGSLICELERAKWDALLESGWTAPERWQAKGRDGSTDIYGIIIRPRNMTPGKKYPIVEKIYAGPHDSHVPKAFGLLRQEHDLANRGFIVVRIDGMGTNNRGKQFHDVCWKNLADAGFPDRIAWIRNAADTYSEMDIDRVGIFGGSAGGQNAMRALIDHHDFYQVAVADCGCHDNRMDKIWWNEAWMGWPVDQSYEDSSNVAHAYRMQGNLLLIVGELDQNVDPASTMQVVDALVKASKDFEFLIVPGAGHGAAETPYASERRWNFLVKHLIGD